MRIHINLPPELVEQIDQALGDVSRSRYLRRIIEAHLSGMPAAAEKRPAPPEVLELAELGSPPGRDTDTPPYRKGYGPDVSRVVGSGRAKQGVEPIPK